jgi:hypothetical protein
VRTARGRGTKRTSPFALVSVEKKIDRQRIRTHSSKGPIDALCKFIKGGKKTFMEMARFASQIEPQLQVIIESYEKLTPPGQRSADLDALCKLNDVDPAHFLGVVAEAAQKFSSNSSILIAALNMPSVVQKSIKEALKTDGIQDRKMLFQHSGFIPTPGGTNISIVQKQQANASAGATERGMPSFEEDIIDVETAVRE